ncbi:FadR/GntR family transcriptional regulator [Anaerosacchariphilus polymeriproducens]|uniref:FadR family transcriptional regulator n=1 Tax=Anaerosacchariphilus polymeriproducens TaxID=1812858 RepID=A0A371AR80_9FIRM|nr:FadR/GntR family transcriptional regulator [Anaerosacchariphilus polymeriproducens]RDU22042.1 FadR family transcriptional regulator [Anaerosacchariphilus polymeriproducens]
MLKSVHPVQKRLPELVSEQIKELIASKDLKIGDKLPNEFDMAEQLQVGRGTIREAVKILVSQNILEIRRGCGTFVSERKGIMDDPLGLWIIEDKQKLALDLCQVRLMLEPQLARLAAQNATDEDIAQLWKAAKAVEEKIREGKNHSDEDIYLHVLIANISHNEVVTKLISVIQSAVYLFIKITKSILREETIQTHEAIVSAIANKDAVAAENAMRKHLLLNQSQILNK